MGRCNATLKGMVTIIRLERHRAIFIIHIVDLSKYILGSQQYYVHFRRRGKVG